jgi:hypothetical protein
MDIRELMVRVARNKIKKLDIEAEIAATKETLRDHKLSGAAQKWIDRSQAYLEGQENTLENHEILARADEEALAFAMNGKKGNQLQPIVWHGAQKQLVACIVEWYQKGWVKAEDEKDAVRRYATYFRRISDGKPVNLEAAWKTYRK